MRLRHSTRGSVLMEFIMVAPLLLILISMLLQFAQIWVAREITAYAAFCAARAVLPAHDKDAAQRAAELTCSWMCLAGLPGAAKSAGGRTESVTLAKFHDRDDISNTETVTFDNGAGVDGEILLPGWGSIPGSDSAEKRVKVTIETISDTVVAKVEFKFPLMMPLAGRMISWFVNSGSDSGLGRAGTVDYGFHNTTDGDNKAWNGQETVMDKDGNLVDRKGANWGDDGRFPAITLTEWCILPRSYSGKSLPNYAKKYPVIGGDS